MSSINTNEKSRNCGDAIVQPLRSVASEAATRRRLTVASKRKRRQTKKAFLVRTFVAACTVAACHVDVVGGVSFQEEADSHRPSALVGVVGGIGPTASLRLQQLVLEKDMVRCSRRDEKLSDNGFLLDACHTPLLMYTNPQIPNNNRAVLGTGSPSVDALVDSAVALRNAGTNVVAFCCTAAYTWMDQVSLRANVPVLDLIDLTARRVMDVAKTHRVGLIEVDGTIAAGTFQAAFDRYGVEVILPQPFEQLTVMKAVADLKAGVKATDGPLTNVLEVVQQLVHRDDVYAFVLGCTEIAAALGQQQVDGDGKALVLQDVTFIDTLDVLAEEIIRVTWGVINHERARDLAEDRHEETDDGYFRGFLTADHQNNVAQQQQQQQQLRSQNNRPER